MSTYREQQRGRAGWSRTRWLILGAVLVAIAVAVVLIVVYSGGGSSGGVGYEKKRSVAKARSERVFAFVCPVALAPFGEAEWSATTG